MEQELLKLILTNVQEMRGDISEIKERITNVEQNVKELTDRVTNVEKEMKATKELAEFNKENIESIKRVVTSHYQEFKKFVKSNATQHNVYNAKLMQY